MTRRKLLNRVTGPVADGYVRGNSGPNAADDVPPNVFVVPGMFAPPNCHWQVRPWPRVVKNG